MITSKTSEKQSKRKVQRQGLAGHSSYPLLTYDPQRSVEYMGVVNYGTTERVIEEITHLYCENTLKEIYLKVTSAGGPTGTAMSFYDHMRYILKPRLITIGSGDVDSSGMLIFLAGNRRYLTKNTTLLLHRAGRIFDGGQLHRQ